MGLGNQSITGEGDSVFPRQKLCGISGRCIQKRATILMGDPVVQISDAEQKPSF